MFWLSAPAGEDEEDDSAAGRGVAMETDPVRPYWPGQPRHREPEPGGRWPHHVSAGHS